MPYTLRHAALSKVLQSPVQFVAQLKYVYEIKTKEKSPIERHRIRTGQIGQFRADTHKHPKILSTIRPKLNQIWFSKLKLANR